jgi:hypothetical protein
MAANPPTCRICGGTPTIDAHLYPRALGHDMRDDEKHLYVGAAGATGKTIVQAGLFDRNVLCAEHDGVLGRFDAYGIEFCRTFNSRVSASANGIWQVPAVNSDMLVKFWLGCLWRFSISTLPQAAKVNLGPFEDRLRDILFGTALCHPEPAVMLMRYHSRVIPPERICFIPYVTKFQPTRCNAYGLAIGGLHAFVKVDSRPLPDSVSSVAINGRSTILGGTLEFESTKQFAQMQRIARNMAATPASRSRLR